ncbi:S-layer family protein, partial [cf. Phormidesmis sp. LEGE 11477]
RLAAGSRVSASTSGSGDGGNLILKAPDAITVSGPGELAVETSGGTDDAGEAGDITAEARSLTFSDGVRVSASTEGAGAAGNIIFNLSEQLVIDSSTIESSTTAESTGVAGNINISAAETILRNDGRITVDSEGEAPGGNIALDANSLALDNSRISATTLSSNGGNLTFNLQDLLLLRNGSLITTEAGTAGTGGNGGNIVLGISEGFVVAVPSENSDIRANAFEGNGGNVDITARSLFGIVFRPDVLDTPESDITASSRFGSSGTVVVNELNPEAVQTEIELPTETAVPPLAQGCRARNSRTNSFVATGRGGLPTNPADPLSADTVWQDIAPFESDSADSNSIVSNRANVEVADIKAPIVEAQHWTRTASGSIVLVARSEVAAEGLNRASLPCHS